MTSKNKLVIQNPKLLFTAAGIFALMTLFAPADKQLMGWIISIAYFGWACYEAGDNDRSRQERNLNEEVRETPPALSRHEPTISQDIPTTSQTDSERGGATTRLAIEEKRRDDVIVTYHDDGQIKSEVQYMDGQKHGRSTYYHRDGSIKSECDFQRGQRHGQHVLYYLKRDGGGKQQEMTFKSGKLHGWNRTYLSCGSLWGEAEYKDGLSHGLHRGWHADKPSQISCEGQNSRGRQVGEWKYWNREGCLCNVETYEDGVLITSQNQTGGGERVVEHYPSGKVKSEGFRDEDGRVGNWTYWYESGSKQQEGRYREDKRFGAWTEWHENGQRSAAGGYGEAWNSANKEGTWTYWDQNGCVRDKERYEGGILVERQDRSGGGVKSVERDSRGNIVSEGYIDAFGSEVGDWVYYHSDIGIKSSEGAYARGRKVGIWTEWNRQGQKVSQGGYKDGRQHGEWTIWDNEIGSEMKESYDDGEQF